MAAAAALCLADKCPAQTKSSHVSVVHHLSAEPKVEAGRFPPGNVPLRDKSTAREWRGTARQPGIQTSEEKQNERRGEKAPRCGTAAPGTAPT